VKAAGKTASASVNAVLAERGRTESAYSLQSRSAQLPSQVHSPHRHSLLRQEQGEHRPLPTRALTTSKTQPALIPLHQLTADPKAQAGSTKPLQWTPINNALTAPEVNQFAWRAESGTMQSYRHTNTGRHIHIDGSTGKFYNQDRVPITKDEALAHAMPERHSQGKTPQSLNQPSVSQSQPASDNSHGMSI